MDSPRRPSPFSIFLLVFLPVAVVRGTGAAGVFKVQRKFVSGSGHHTIADLKNHDVNRHARILSTAAVDVPLGGNGLPTSLGYISLFIF